MKGKILEINKKFYVKLPKVIVLSLKGTNPVIELDWF